MPHRCSAETAGGLSVRTPSVDQRLCSDDVPSGRTGSWRCTEFPQNLRAARRLSALAAQTDRRAGARTQPGAVLAWPGGSSRSRRFVMNAAEWGPAGTFHSASDPRGNLPWDRKDWNRTRLHAAANGVQCFSTARVRLASARPVCHNPRAEAPTRSGPPTLTRELWNESAAACPDQDHE